MDFGTTGEEFWRQEGLVRFWVVCLVDGATDGVGVMDITVTSLRRLQLEVNGMVVVAGVMETGQVGAARLLDGEMDLRVIAEEGVKGLGGEMGLRVTVELVKGLGGGVRLQVPLLVLEGVAVDLELVGASVAEVAEVAGKERVGRHVSTSIGFS